MWPPVYLPGSTAVDVGDDWFDSRWPTAGWASWWATSSARGGGRGHHGPVAKRDEALTLDQRTPGETVTKLNLLLSSYGRPVCDAGLRHARSAELDATVTSAGHPPPLVVEPDGEIRYLEGGGGLPLGADPDASYTGRRPSSRAPSSCSTRTVSSSVPTGRSTRASTCWQPQRRRRRRNRTRS